MSFLLCFVGLKAYGSEAAVYLIRLQKAAEGLCCAYTAAHCSLFSPFSFSSLQALGFRICLSPDMELSVSSLAVPCRSSSSLKCEASREGGKKLRCTYTGISGGPVGKLLVKSPVGPPAGSEAVAPLLVESRLQGSTYRREASLETPSGAPVRTTSEEPPGAPSRVPSGGPLGGLSCAVCGRPAGRRLRRLLGSSDRVGGQKERDSPVRDISSFSSFAIGNMVLGFCLPAFLFPSPSLNGFRRKMPRDSNDAAANAAVAAAIAAVAAAVATAIAAVAVAVAAAFTAPHAGYKRGSTASSGRWDLSLPCAGTVSSLDSLLLQRRCSQQQQQQQEDQQQEQQQQQQQQEEEGESPPTFAALHYEEDDAPTDREDVGFVSREETTPASYPSPDSCTTSLSANYPTETAAAVAAAATAAAPEEESPSGERGRSQKEYSLHHSSSGSSSSSCICSNSCCSSTSSTIRETPRGNKDGGDDPTGPLRDPGGSDPSRCSSNISSTAAAAATATTPALTETESTALGGPGGPSYPSLSTAERRVSGKEIGVYIHLRFSSVFRIAGEGSINK